MPTYLPFSGCDYYPSGGADDLVEVFEATDDTAAVASLRERLGPVNAWEKEWSHMIALDGTETRRVHR